MEFRPTLRVAYLAAGSVRGQEHRRHDGALHHGCTECIGAAEAAAVHVQGGQPWRL